MPIYLDHAIVETEFSKEVAEAILHIKAATTGLAVTPSISLSLMRQYFGPLLPHDHRDVFNNLKTAAWDDLFMIYVKLASRSEGEHNLLLEVGCAVRAIHSHSTAQPRGFTFSDFIEVTYFLDLCDRLKMPIREVCQPDRIGNCGIFRFCKYCWRPPLPSRTICAIHSPGNKLQAQNNIGGSSQTRPYASYKESQRQKSIFDKAINEILTAEVIEFHNNNFATQILFPQAAIGDWLSMRRPHLWNMLGNQQKQLTDQTAVDILLDFLHDGSNLAESAQDAYNKTNELIRSRPILIWPTLLRAEAWFIARESSHRGWGGSRHGAGRKPSYL